MVRFSLILSVITVSNFNLIILLLSIIILVDFCKCKPGSVGAREWGGVLYFTQTLYFTSPTGRGEKRARNTDTHTPICASFLRFTRIHIKPFASVKHSVGCEQI